jgi:hypothetical protein
VPLSVPEVHQLLRKCYAGGAARRDERQAAKRPRTERTAALRRPRVFVAEVSHFRWLPNVRLPPSRTDAATKCSEGQHLRTLRNESRGTLTHPLDVENNQRTSPAFCRCELVTTSEPPVVCAIDDNV